MAYQLLHVGSCHFREWEPQHTRQFDQLFERALKDFEPHAIFTFGGSREDVRRQKLAKEHGCRVIFGLRNWGYLVPGFFDHIDAILACSQFCADRYRERLGVQATALPIPMDLQEVVAEDHERVFITYVNPSREKGVMFFATLAEVLAKRRPDIPIMVFDARGTGAMLAEAGRAGGYDLTRHECIFNSRGVAHPRDIYAAARIVVAPHALEEPSGRIAAEALVNAVPPIVSDRGGLSEVANDGGFVLPLPDALTPQSEHPVAPETVTKWADLIERLADDEPFYTRTCERAKAAASVYQPEALAEQYQAYFREQLA